MSSIYFDCFSGISGDMTLGALIDAGLSLDTLRGELQKLNLTGWTIDAEAGMRGFIAGTSVHVYTAEQHTHRNLATIQSIVQGSFLDQAVIHRSMHVFRLLAEAEGTIHGVPANEVQFHEVGALDAIIDIVGVVAGLAALGITEVYASPLPLGNGWVRAAHGLLPVPAPAVLHLLAAVGAPIIPDDTPAELVTPTGAALLAGLAIFRRPPMQLKRIGYGLGQRQLERPNALRVWLGTTDLGAESRTLTIETDERARYPVLLETNLDDQPPEQVAYVMERLFELGALDVWLTPIQMKKGRLAMLLSVLSPPELEAGMVTVLMRETTTLGIRRRSVERYVCERSVEVVTTPLGPIRYKRKVWQGEDMGMAPEYEDCAKLAREHALPLQEVYRLAHEAARP